MSVKWERVQAQAHSPERRLLSILYFFQNFIAIFIAVFIPKMAIIVSKSCIIHSKNRILKTSETTGMQRKNPVTIAVTGFSIWSECRDLNPRPLGPEPSAIPNFATPRWHRYYTHDMQLCQEEKRFFANFFFLAATRRIYGGEERDETDFLRLFNCPCAAFAAFASARRAALCCGDCRDGG